VRARHCYVLDVKLRRVPDTERREKMWDLVSTSIGVLGAMLAKRSLRIAYRALRKDRGNGTPFDPTSPQFSWPEALLWGAAVGIGLAIAKMVGDRAAALGWQVATGTLPPGVVDEPARD
jgi:hypothetical protein